MRPAVAAFALGVLASALAGCLGPAPEFSGGGLFQRPVPVALAADGLVVGGQAFVVKGVDYEPVNPDGSLADWETWNADEDLAGMKRMGLNTVRVRAFPDPALGRFLDAASALDLKVVVVVSGPADPSRVSEAESRAMERTLRTLIARHANHPALLLWQVGDGWDARASGDVGPWLPELERLAAVAHREDPRHPVLSVVAGIANASLVRSAAPSVDLVGVAVAPGEAANLSGDGPFLVEIVTDAWNDERGVEDDEAQALAVVRAWNALRQSRVALPGAILAAWSDRWDLVGGPQQDASASEPDVEWRGANRLVNGTLQPRAVVGALAAQWASDADGTPPAILHVEQHRDGDALRVAARVVTYGGLNATVDLQYRAAAGSWSSTPMVMTAPERWEAALVGADAPLLFLRVHAIDDAGRERTSENAVFRPAPAAAFAAVAALAAAAVLGRRARG